MIMKWKKSEKNTLTKACWSSLGFPALLVQSCSYFLEHAEELCARERSRIIVRVGTGRVTKVPMKYFVLQPAVSWHKLGTILVSPLLHHKFNLETYEITQQDEKTKSLNFFLINLYFCNIWMQNKNSGCILFWTLWRLVKAVQTA